MAAQSWKASLLVVGIAPVNFNNLMATIIAEADLAMS